MNGAKGTSAVSFVGQLLEPLLPARWQLIEHEGAATANDVTRVRVTTSSIRHSDTGDSSEHLVTVRITVTVPTDTLEVAERRLDDDMDLFLFALDRTGLPWDTATKGRYGDENARLGYQFDITDIRTNLPEDD